MPKRSTAWGAYACAAAVVLFLGAFLLWPLGHVFVRACWDKTGPTFTYFRALLVEPANREAIGRSFLIAALVTAGCLVLSIPLAWLFARRSFAGKTGLGALLLLPMILPPFVGAVGMKIVFARAGALSTLLMRLGLVNDPVDWLGSCPLLGVVVQEVLHLFPILYLNLVAAFANVDPTLEEAASNLGASPLRVFRRVTLPLAGPGLFAGVVLVFIWSFTELGTPLVFGVRGVLPVMIYDAVNEVGTNPMAYAQVVFVLLVAALGFWTAKYMRSRGRDVTTLGRLAVARQDERLGGWATVRVYLSVGSLLLLAVVPHASVILLACSRRWFLTVLPEGFTLEFFQRAMGSELTRQALVNSLGLSLCSAGLDVVLGFGVAWICVRTRMRGRDGLDALAMAPLAIPGVVVAFSYMGTFSGGWFRDTIFDPRVNPMALLAISYAIRRLPYMVRAAHAGLEQVSTVYEEAAANLGARPMRVIRRVTLPLIGANLLAGGILCISFSMLEVSDSLILAQSEAHYPITKAIYVLMETLDNGVNVAAALGVWAMVLLCAAMLWTSTLLGRRMGQMFRI